MDAHHRKIDLQSPADLTYLLTNIKAAAQSKIDLAIPPSAAPEGEDAYRSRVEELVQEYILRTLSLALPSLSINGLNPSPTLLRPDPAPVSLSAEDIDTGNYQPYDPRLADRLRKLYSELDMQSTCVAELRRSAPEKAAQRYMERLEEELRVEREMEARKREGGEGGDVQEDREFRGLERRDEVERMWGRGTEGLVGLKTVTGVVASLERAGRAVDVVEVS